MDHFWSGLSSAIGGIVTAIVVFAILAMCGPEISNSFKEASCADPKGLDRAEQPTRVEATSQLPPQESISYGPNNLVDGDTGTAWVEGADGLGVKERITFTWTARQNIKLICVVNGYGKSWTSYTTNARLRLVNVSTNDEDAEESALSEQNESSFAEFQKLEGPQGETSAITIEILAVRAGRDDSEDVKRASDMAISEIEFWVSD
ncbi:hypothetical protein [Parafrankia sp. EUN1f]|uniref:NADase-type glycan-binding domain-containing protein n=1 Tax=Parafrankia sp. EUN1f TaxID=102897 RepID=UPI0012FCC4CA|nr:hypothetical protein [Parafrankia sp. EUN1f]